MSVRAWVCAAGLLALAAAADGGAPGGVPGRVEAVTLYRGQALVTRAVPVEGGEGRLELVVSDLPENIVGDSLFAEGGDGLEVRAVRFRTRAVGEEPREEVRQLDEQIQAGQDRVERNKRMQQVVGQRLALLGSLDNFAVPTAKADLAKGVLDFNALKQIALFSFEQRELAAQDALKLEIEARELAKQVALLQRQRGELTSRSSRTVREALVFLEKRGAAKGELKLSYLVSQAGWNPAYNFTAANGAKEVAVEYNAITSQMSGEDWNGVALTLSTASPSLIAQGPGLAPFRVSLSPAQGKGQVNQREEARRFQFAQNRLQKAEEQQRTSQGLKDNRGFNWEMNAAANDVQGIELTLERDALDVLSTEPSAGGDVTSVSYKLASPVSLASRSDQQSLRIAEMKLPCRFYHVATPVLTSYVYREAELTNTGSDALLQGQVSVYLDGRFVGRGLIPTVARGEKFVMGFGADPQTRARRDLVTKSEGVQGGNREITLTYRITLENYKDTPVSVRLFDRMPLPDRRTDVRVTLGETSDKLSDDKLYDRIERPKSILRWDIEVPAGAAGEKARSVTYTYKLEYDRNLQLGMPVERQAGEAKEEFEQLEYQRRGF